jgi:F0F1-type ATP synthase membrane subunit b/b'
LHRADDGSEAARRVDGGLFALLEAEAKFESTLDAARAEAASIIDAAERAVEALERETKSAFDEEAGRLRESIARETSEEIAALRHRHARDLERLEAVDDGARRRLIDLVLHELVAGLHDDGAGQGAG